MRFIPVMPVHRLSAAPLLLGLLGLTACGPQSSVAAQPAPAGSTAPQPARPTGPAGTVKAKLLTFGWETPTPAAVAANLAGAEGAGFDAWILRPETGRNVFVRTPHPDAGFQRDLSALNTLKAQSPRMKDSFLIVQATPGEYNSAPGSDRTFDWFDDAHWASAEQNLRAFGKLVKAGGMRGIFFDSEPYFGTRPWGYTEQPNRGTRSFADYQAQMRKRGAQFMRALEAEAPGLTIFATRLLSTVDNEVERGQPLDEIIAGLPEQQWYGLWPAFVEGMLEGATPQARFIDGLEATYSAASAADFDRWRRWVKEGAPGLLRPENRARYAAQVSVSNGLFLEGLMNDYDDPRFLGYYLPGRAERLKLAEHNVYHGLRAADEFAWVYEEQYEFFRKTPPADVAAAIARGKQKFQAGQALGFDSSFAADAGKRFAGRVNFAGLIRDAAGAGVGGVVVGASAQGISCSGTDGAGLYTCVSVPGWSGTLTPALAGYRFSPATRTYSNVTQGQFGQGFTASK